MTGGTKELFEKFEQDTRNELWIKRDELVHNIQNPGVVDSYISGETGYNLLFIHKAIGMNRLVDELKKWDKMDCYVVLHSDFSSIKDMPWVHQTYTNKKTGKYYITNTIKPIMSDIKIDKVITFVYNTENYEDFIANNIDSSKIIRVYEPKLPIFSLENSINRNDVWREIDNQCTDIYWTQACRSGLQYHNNGIVSAKRVVRSLHGLGW